MSKCNRCGKVGLFIPNYLFGKQGFCPRCCKELEQIRKWRWFFRVVVAIVYIGFVIIVGYIVVFNG